MPRAGSLGRNTRRQSLEGPFLGVLHRPGRRFLVLEPLAASACATLASDLLHFLSLRTTVGGIVARKLPEVKTSLVI